MTHTDTTHTNPFQNTGLTELEKAWKDNSSLDLDILLSYTEQNFDDGIYAVSLFLADKIIKEKSTSENTLVRLRYIRGYSYYEFKFYREAYKDFAFYLTKQPDGRNVLAPKLAYAKRMIHTGNNGSLLFVAVFGLSIALMFALLYKVQEAFPENFDMGLNMNYVLYSVYGFTALLLFGLFYRYVIIARMKYS